jgi:hypothetical protein
MEQAQQEQPREVLVRHRQGNSNTTTMLVTANIATYPKRLPLLLNMLKTIDGQFDVIRICLNEYERIPDELRYFKQVGKSSMYLRVQEHDLKDNGKYVFLDTMQREQYFTLDDDILYPSDYVRTMTEALRVNPIVTHHGRLLLGRNRSYYSQHKRFHFAEEIRGKWQVDVLGTGVSAFDTSVVKPEWIAYDERQCMTDLLFSLECAMYNQPITLLPHAHRWLMPQDSERGDSIFEKFHKKETEQIKIADEIYHLRYPNQNA